MKQDNNSVVINMNSGYFPYSLVMLRSLFDNNPDLHFCIYLLYSDMKKWELDYLGRFIGNFHNEFVPLEVDYKVFEGFPLNARWSIETYYRLLISKLLPDDLLRVLYLDIDLIIDGDISELFRIEMGTCYLAACEELYENINYHNLNQKWKRMEDIKYFNAGVMVLNLTEIRRAICFDDYIKVIQITHGELPYMDQDILNYLLGENVKYLKPKYNHVVGLQTNVQQSGVIYHYGTPEKPWNTKKEYTFKDIWWKYAEKVIDYTNILEKVIKERESCVNV